MPLRKLPTWRRDRATGTSLPYLGHDRFRGAGRPGPVIDGNLLVKRVSGLSGQPVLTVFRVTMGVSFERGFRTWSIPGSNVTT